MNRWKTPLGTFDINVGEHGVSSVALTDGVEFESVEKDLFDALDEHLHGRPSALAIDLKGVRPLAQLTLAKLLEIPYGEVRSYAWVAKEIGRPTAVRAVANAVAGNPVPILIPCHRVVRTDGQIGKFRLGAEIKRQLLEFEGVDIPYLEGLVAGHVRYIADAEQRTYHLPTCRLRPPVGSENYQELRGVTDAAERSVEPCRRCRPL